MHSSSNKKNISC